MTDYSPPIDDMSFLLNNVFDGQGLGEFDADMVNAILEEAGKVASGVLSPLNRIGDEQGATLKDGVVTTAKGFKAQSCWQIQMRQERKQNRSKAK